MKQHRKQKDILERAIETLEAGAPDPGEVNASTERVWQRIQQEVAPTFSGAPAARAAQIEGCAGFRALLPAYLGATLTPARTLLLRDHLAECVECRHALERARALAAPQLPVERLAVSRTRPQWLNWRIAAAAAALVIAVAVFPLFERLLPAPGGLNATVQAAEGPLLSFTARKAIALHPGSTVSQDEILRTGTDGHARVRLADGSLIEINKRSEFSLSRSLRGTTIHLQRGSVIVQAAHQNGTHLFVATRDALISVTGTIFAVDSGTKGSRVSVIRGEVRVNHFGRENVLHAGDEVTTEPSLSRVDVREDVAWSDNAAQYAALLAGLSDIRREVSEIPLPGMRTSSRLLGMMPAATVFYAALPNLSTAIQQSYGVIQQRIEQNPALRQWWQAERGAVAQRFVDQVDKFGPALGDEIAIGAELGPGGRFFGPLILAELRDADGLRSAMESENTARAARGESPEFRLVTNPLATPATVGQGAPLLVWIDGDVLAATPEPALLRQFAVRRAGDFTATPFGERVEQAYAQGVSILVAADLRQIVAAETPNAKPVEQAALARLGITNLDSMIANERLSAGHSDVRAILAFQPSSTGIPSWLASPGPMGALDYISPEANFVTAFVVKNPQALVRDLLSAISAVEPDSRTQLDKLRTEHGIDLEHDFAAQLGGEAAFAIDGPILPTPAWKAIFEVSDPTQAEATIERLIQEANSDATNRHKLVLQSSKSGEQVLYTVSSSESSSIQASYAFSNGYLVVAPTPALVLRALQSQQSGSTIQHAARFTATLPLDSTVNFSALVYHDFAPVLQTAEQLAVLTPAQRESLRALAAEPPNLLYANAEDNQIAFAASGQGSLFGITPAGLLGMPNSFEIQNLLEKAMHQQIPAR